MIEYDVPKLLMSSNFTVAIVQIEEKKWNLLGIDRACAWFQNIAGRF